MAESNRTIDPNDLDSIDALLDEAEFNLDDDVGSAVENPTQEDNGDLDVLDDPDLDPETLLDDSLDDGIAIDPELSANEEQALNDMLGLDDDVPAEPDQSPNLPIPDGGASFNRQGQDKADEVISRRAQSAHKSDELTVEEMDSIRKIVIGFGSALVVLVIIAIIMATWAAMGSKGDSELESILLEAKEELEITRVAAQGNERSLRELNRKLDAVSFQVEQLSADVMSQQQPNGLVLRGAAPSESSVPATTPHSVAVSPAIEAKIDSLTRNLAVAQRRIVEVNNRVTSVQTQQSSILQAVKSMEKTLLEKQLTLNEPEAKQVTKDAASEVKSRSQTSEYRYQAPPASGLMFQPGHGGVYP